MKTLDERTIGNWLADIQSGRLRLPRFQRDYVWRPCHVAGLLKTLIVDNDIPIGVLLVLETDSDADNQAFKTRNIDGAPDDGGESCREFLLDGQQRLTALWRSLNDKDDKCTYYVEFRRYKPEAIVSKRNAPKTSERLANDPSKQIDENLFPVRLLNPLNDTSKIDEWTTKASLSAVANRNVKDMILKARRRFQNENKGGAIMIPYFKLGSKTDPKKAIDIYKTLNTNSIRLSHYFLAAAEMESQAEKSLYDLASELERKTRVKRFETDVTGELILKIFCLISNVMPAKGEYEDLPYKKLESNKSRIINGVKWTIEKFESLGIWDGKQLPTVVPLRVLPALHEVFCGKEESDRNRRIVNKYLWHSFLTERYSMHANQHLKEDFDDLVAYIDGRIKENQIRIFKFSQNVEDIKKVKWPQTTRKSTRARGVLLVCCSGGAKNLKDGVKLSKANIGHRERHHVFPKTLDFEANKDIVLNCMLIPKDENTRFSNHLPGDYIAGLFPEIKSSGRALPEADIVERLDTHCIESGITEKLVDIREGEDFDLETEYVDFIEQRSRVVGRKIQKLILDGEL